MRGEHVPAGTRWAGNPIAPWQRRRRRDRAGPPATDDPYVPGRGNPGYEVTRYDLDLAYRIGTNHLTGRARISAVATDHLGRSASTSSARSG